MAAKSAAKAEKRRHIQVNWRYVILMCLLSALLVGVVFGAQKLEQFVIRDPRFVLPPPREYGEESPNLHITGVQYASRRQVIGVFRPDIGRSLYLFPLEDRRKTLLRVPWVKEAGILRTWPNEISVRIAERRPVAFVQLRSESISRWSLIDADGVILEPPDKTPFQLPVITGVRQTEAPTARSVRVHRMLQLQDDLGPLKEKVSEFDVADLDDLKVTVKMGEHAVMLMLGDHNFRSRFQSFLDHYATIQKRIAGLTVLDLRLDDRITVLGGRRE